MVGKLTAKERIRLLEEARVYYWLTFSQLFKLILWESFYFYAPCKERVDTFYNSLKIGKAAIFAFRDADIIEREIVKCPVCGTTAKFQNKIDSDLYGWAEYKGEWYCPDCYIYDRNDEVVILRLPGGVKND